MPASVVSNVMVEGGGRRASSSNGGGGGGQEPVQTLPSYVRLVSGDGLVFTVERNVAGQSPVLTMFLDPQLGWRESTTTEIVLNDIPGRLLDRVCQYLHYRRRYNYSDDPPPFDIAADESFDLMLVADYLEV